MSIIQTTFRMLLALMIGAVGSIVFIYLSLPLPWLLGAIFASSIAMRLRIFQY